MAAKMLTPPSTSLAADQAAPMISWRGVYKSFAAHQVQLGISLQVRRGDVHFIVGRSGAGKSVLIKEVVGLIQPDRGVIELAGESVNGLSEHQLIRVRQRCQYIFQHASLFDSLTVMENVAMPLRHRFSLARKPAQATAMEVLAQVGAASVSTQLPAALGTGAQKRVAIARALALKPEVLLYDEPTTGLDPIAARRIDALIRRSTDDGAGAITSVVVSHDLISVAAIADRVTLLHQGGVLFDGPPVEFFASEDADVRAFARAGDR